MYFHHKCLFCIDLQENGGFTRIGFFHYNTLEEVRRVGAPLADIASTLGSQ